MNVMQFPPGYTGVGNLRRFAVPVHNGSASQHTYNAARYGKRNERL
jgi:hypothetical protein